MSFLPEDLEEIQQATGLNEAAIIGHDELENEYMQIQRMYHATGGQGPLPQMMLIMMLRMMGIDPPVLQRPPVAVNWMNVPFGTKVVVAAEHGTFLGLYVGMIEIGSLAVRFENDPLVHEFTPQFVSLPGDTLPKGIQVTWSDPTQGPPKPSEEYRAAAAAKAKLLREQLQEESGEPVEETDEGQTEEFQKIDRNDPEGRMHGPRVKPHILMLADGDRVFVETADDYKDAQFLSEGPGDNQVTVWLDGKEQVFEDSKITAAEVGV